MRKRFFEYLALVSCRWPVTVLIVGSALAIIGILLASKLQMQTSRIDLLSKDSPQSFAYQRFTQEFGTANNIYFVLEGPSLEETKECADALAAEIMKHPEYIRDEFHKLDVERVKAHLLLYLEIDQLHRLDEYLSDESEFLADLMQAENLNAVFSVMEGLARKRTREDFKNPAMEIEVAAFASLLELLNSYLWDDKDQHTIDLLPPAAVGSLPFMFSNDPGGYIVGKDGSSVFLLARPNAAKEDSIEFLRPMMAALESARTDILKEYPGVNVGMTGLPVFAYGDLKVMENEIPMLSLAALAIVATLFLIFFRFPLEIGFAGVSLLVAFACALGASTLTIGHLNIMSSVFGLTMIGLGIDFGIHIIARLDDESAKSAHFEDAMKQTLTGSGPPISTGALTTAAAFFLLSVADFRGLAELGIIAGSGILFCLATMLTILPSFLSLRHRQRGLSRGPSTGRRSILPEILHPLGTLAEKYAGRILAISIPATIVMGCFASRVGFDYNFMNIQPKNALSAHFEEILMTRTGLAPSFNVIMREDLESLGQAETELAALPSVSRVESASGLIPTNQEEKLPAVANIIAGVKKIGEAPRKTRRPPDINQLVIQYERMSRRLRAALKSKSLAGNESVLSHMRRCSVAAEKFLQNMEDSKDTTILPRLERFSKDLFSYAERQVTLLGSESQLEKVEISDFPENIRTRFVGRTGKYAAYVFPSQSVWDKEFLDKFNADVTAIAPAAAGTTLFAQALLDDAARTLRQCRLLVPGAVLLLLFLDFRRLTPTLLGLLAVTVGVIWMLGIMALVGWHYNPINMLAVPLMLGVGIDNGVHIVHRFRDSNGNIEETLKSSGRAIMVSSLTTIGGFACLTFSTHRGLIGLGQLMVLGVACCLVASLTVLPAALKGLNSLGLKI